MRQVEVPGGTALFRERSELRGRDRNLIEAASMSAVSAISKLPEDAPTREEGETDEAFAGRLAKTMEGVTLTFQESLALMDLREAAVIATLSDWSLDLPLPNIQTLGDLPVDLYEGLLAAVGGEALAMAIPTTFDATPDRDSPIGDSRSSDGPLKGDLESTSLPTSENDGDPIAGEPSTPVP
jgi:hypothetical protein